MKFLLSQSVGMSMALLSALTQSTTGLLYEQKPQSLQQSPRAAGAHTVNIYSDSTKKLLGTILCKTPSILKPDLGDAGRCDGIDTKCSSRNTCAWQSLNATSHDGWRDVKKCIQKQHYSCTTTYEAVHDHSDLMISRMSPGSRGKPVYADLVHGAISCRPPAIANATKMLEACPNYQGSTRSDVANACYINFANKTVFEGRWWMDEYAMYLESKKYSCIEHPPLCQKGGSGRVLFSTSLMLSVFAVMAIGFGCGLY